MTEAQVVGIVTHRALNGSWALCPDADACRLLFHFPNQTPAQLAALPEPMLYALLDAVQPPSVVTEKRREWHDEQGLVHRDYDLPAAIEASGSLFWYRSGNFHRDGDRPAAIYADGWREWRRADQTLVRQIVPNGPYITVKVPSEWVAEAQQLTAQLTAAASQGA